MDLRIGICCVCLLLPSGCAHAPKQANAQHNKTMMDVYHQSQNDAKADVEAFVTQHLKDEDTFGYVKPYVPVMLSPIVKKVWIPPRRSLELDHVLIAGHWEYIMIKGPRWYIDHD